MSRNATEPGMSLIVKTVTHWLKAFILLFGIYVVLYGHVSPGGGFAGGVVVACAFILLTLAWGKEIAGKVLSDRVAAILGGLGALLFLGVAVAGMWCGKAFLHNFLAHEAGAKPGFLSGGMIEVCEIAIGFIVSMSLFLAFSALSTLHVSAKAREPAEGPEGEE